MKRENMHKMSSDISKTEKLAAARKKLKEFQNQQKNKENTMYMPLTSECIKSDVNRGIPPFSQTQELTCIDQIYNTTRSEAPVIMNDGQSPQLSHYFSDASKKNFLYDDNSKNDSIITKSSDVSDFLISNSSLPPTSPSSVSAEVTVSPICFDGAPTSSLPTEGVEILSDSKSDIACGTLKKELARAETKIRMQAEALDIITAEREDVLKKLQSALKEIDGLKENVLVLRNELGESLVQKENMNRLISELKNLNESTSINSQTLEKNINNLKEKNEELEQVLKLQLEKNVAVQKQLDETQSHHDMLVLKFQQLGIETSRDNTDCKAMCEESNSIKRKYAELEEQFKTLAFEKEHTDNEYRQYIQILQAELHQTKAELQKLSLDDQELVDKISSQTEHISSLEKMLQKSSIKETDDQLVTDLRSEIKRFKEKMEQEKEQYEAALSRVSDYEEWKKKAISLEKNLETLKLEMMNTNELQMAVESNKVAASQAISQNNKLKSELERLNDLIHALNEEKRTLKINLKKAEEEKQTFLLNLREVEAETHQLTESPDPLETQFTNPIERTKNDVAVNTDAQNGGDENVCGKTNIVAMQQLQEKFKSVLDRMADLTDEKQQLEHLVLQLQSETETIEEYVALYQKQRSVLQQRARETDFKMERVAIEKQRLLKVIHSVLKAKISDSNVIKQLIQENLSAELTSELDLCNGPTTIDSAFHIEAIGHHPSCSCCSGKLITI